MSNAEYIEFDCVSCYSTIQSHVPYNVLAIVITLDTPILNKFFETPTNWIELNWNECALCSVSLNSTAVSCAFRFHSIRRKDTWLNIFNNNHLNINKFSFLRSSIQESLEISVSFIFFLTFSLTPFHLCPFNVLVQRKWWFLSSFSYKEEICGQ